jgi:hypothetical protein
LRPCQDVQSLCRFVQTINNQRSPRKLMPKGISLEPWMLHAALAGLKDRKQRLDACIVAVERLLSAEPRQRLAIVEREKQPRRPLSMAARKRIAAAQKRRWAEYRKQRAAAAKGKGKK